MRALILIVLAIGPIVTRLLAQSSGTAPYYTAASIANSASNTAGPYAPNTFLSIYGQNLAYTVQQLLPSDIQGGMLPTDLPGTFLRVLINLIPAYIYYVSPGQVNVLVPSLLAPGPVNLQLELDGIAGPAVPLALAATAPGLFTQADGTTLLATHGDGSVVTAESPAHAGEEIVLYASGLGPVNPPVPSGQIPQSAWQLADRANFQVLINGAAIDAKWIDYAGVAPGFAGLYQINVTLPLDTPANPEVRIGASGALSPAQRYLPVQ